MVSSTSQDNDEHKAAEIASNAQQRQEATAPHNLAGRTDSNKDLTEGGAMIMTKQSRAEAVKPTQKQQQPQTWAEGRRDASRHQA